MHKKSYYGSLFLGLLLFLGFLVFFVSTLGVADISFIDSVKIIVGRIPGINHWFSFDFDSPTHITIIWNIRLPRIFLSLLIGIGLSVVGVTFQGMFKNPMADPHVLGVSSGAALGAVIAMIGNIKGTFLGQSMVGIMAFLGALGTTWVVYYIAKTGHKIPTVTLLLAGVALSFLLSSLISLIIIFRRNQMEQILFWTMGSVAAASWRQVLFLTPFVLGGSIIIFAFSRELNGMLLGEESAKSLGIDVEKTKKILLIISSIVVAATVSVSGIIGFVGLIIPHAVRMMIGPDHRVLLPFSALVGGAFMIFCDTLARILVPPMEIPVGAITALFGSPYFLYLLYKSKKQVLL
ncbi:MAG: iron chelate uptake ABC transporter family permease subunit [Epulopiscium sp.]|nr:iron chelate uptake ABC transporter family permease subunit [Candidatus Epulonipiscium sp.]